MSGACSAGYFCISGSNSATPLVNLTLLGTTTATNTYGLCPQGYYCPASTSDPVACPIGYYLDAEASDALADCIKCPPGQYCATVGLPGPNGKCLAGYYCPEGSTSNTANQCPVGTYCPLGSSVALPCPGGQYQATAGSSACLACTAGNYCPIGSSALTTCPAGAYCPANS